MINPRNYKNPSLLVVNVMADVKDKVVCSVPRTDMDEKEVEGVGPDKVSEETRDTYARVVQRLVGWKRSGPNGGKSNSRVSGNQMNEKGEGS